VRLGFFGLVAYFSFCPSYEAFASIFSRFFISCVCPLNGHGPDKNANGLKDETSHMEIPLSLQRFSSWLTHFHTCATILHTPQINSNESILVALLKLQQVYIFFVS